MGVGIREKRGGRKSSWNRLELSGLELNAGQ